MYKYLINSNSKTVIDEKLNLQLREKLQKKLIYSEFINFSGEKELSDILSSLKKQTTNTLVLIGDDNDFNLLIGQTGKLDSDIAVGYLPIKKSSLSKYLGLSNIQDSINSLSQRKITEKTIYSLSSRYFLDKIDLNFDENHKEKIIITTDKGLEIKIPSCVVSIENLNDDSYLTKTPIQITAYKIESQKQQSKNKTVLAKFIAKFNTNPEKREGLILSLHAKNFRINSLSKAKDSTGRIYNQSILIGKSPKTIRLISKKADIQK
jgi:predicted nuclease of predicted toxin-antitoxin system